MDDDSDTITLTWTAPATGGLDITGYEIQVWNGSRWVPEATPAAADIDYEATGLTPGVTYHYVIRASNSQGVGPWSTSTSATIARHGSRRARSDRQVRRKDNRHSRVDSAGRQRRLHNRLRNPTNGMP